VCKHLAVLHAEGYVARRKEKTSSFYRISDPAVLQLCEQVCSGIQAQLAELNAAVS
jgi:hypothetical protein